MTESGEPNSPRVDRIMSRVRSDTAIRDLAGFGLGRIWLVLLEIFAVFYKLINRGAARDGTPRKRNPAPGNPV